MNRSLCALLAMLTLCFLSAGAKAIEYKFTKIAFAGESAPGTAGAVFSTFGIPMLNNNGTVAFRALTALGVGDTTDANDNGIWTNEGLVIRAGDTAVGTLGSTYSFIEPSINEDGVSAHYGVLTIGVGDTDSLADRIGIWTNDGLLARAGDIAVGTAGGIRAASFGASPAISNSGKVAFWNSLVRGVGDTTEMNDVGIWTNEGLFARTGDIAPGTNGATYSILGTPAINDSGTIAYSAGLNIDTGDSTSANNGGIWSDGQLVVRRGDIAAGTSDRYDVLLRPAINESGMLAYYGQLNVPVDAGGIWTNNGLVARAGDIAPGTAGAKFSAFEWAPSINDSGKVAFGGMLAVGVGDTTAANEIGIWTTDGLVVRAGEVLQISPGDSRTLLAVFVGDTALANDGSVTFLAEFTDRTYGVFLATPVPEPNILALFCVTLAIASLAALTRQRSMR